VIGRTTRHIALLLLTVAACDRKREEPSYAATVADAVPKLEKTLGVKFKTPPKFEVRSKEEVRQFLERRFAEDLPDAELRGSAAKPAAASRSSEQWNGTLTLSFIAFFGGASSTS
jgi:hypothetical protein